MTTYQATRRHIIGGAASIAALGAGLIPRNARAAAAPPLPTSPVTLNVVDVGGQLQLTQGAMQAYVAANPKLVSKISYSQPLRGRDPCLQWRDGSSLRDCAQP